MSRTPHPSDYELHVDIRPEYLPEQSQPDADRYVFAYHVKVENKGSKAAQVIARHWVIKDADGRVDEVRGLGLVGRQPFLQPGQSFEYTSGCPLPTPSGSMRGTFYCMGEEAQPFEVIVLPFELFIPKSMG